MKFYTKAFHDIDYHISSHVMSQFDMCNLFLLAFVLCKQRQVVQAKHLRPMFIILSIDRYLLTFHSSDEHNV